MLIGIDHFALIVSSEETVDFYKKNLVLWSPLEKKESMTQLYYWMLIV